MGVVVSSPVATSAFFLTTGIIGLVSFVFTVGTFLRVAWVNIETLGEAPHQVHTYLTTLRTELLEEKASLKGMRKGLRKHQRLCQKYDNDDLSGMELNDVSLRTMNDAVRAFIKRFRELEKPFLENGDQGINEFTNHRAHNRRRNSSISPPHYTHAAYSSPPEKRSRTRTNHDRDQIDEETEDDAYWAQRTKYGRYTLRCRFKWLTRKSEAQDLLETLSRVQIRRIALQVGGIAVALHGYGTETLELRDTVRRIDQRVSRTAGGRRTDT